MSLLLDALNKADQERKRNEATPGINSNHGQIGEHSTRNISIAVIATALIGFAILLASIYWLGQRSISTAPLAAGAVSSTPAINHAAPPIHQNSSVFATQAPTKATEETHDAEQDVASLYAQNTETTELVAPTPSAEASATAINNNGNTETPTPTPTSITQFANLPNLYDLPNQILVKIPSLNYSEHNYNNAGGNVKINGEIKHANDQLAPDLVIDKILADGMILHLDNYSFKMRALNSWVNM